MSQVILGVAGGIAAYKAAELLRRLQAAGHDVTVIPTAAALEFVGAATWSALSGKPAQTGVFEDAHLVPHVRLGQTADLVIVAPATADLIARAATGRADDLLTSSLLTARCPVILAPAMHTEMWLHPATQANVATLRQRGCLVVDPDSGRLTGPDSGPGRLPDPAELAAVAGAVLNNPEIAARGATRDLAGKRVVVSAGGTREQLDPVRFIGNRSSGLMGWALARAAVLRGAVVDLVAANVNLPAPPGTELHPISSTGELAAAMGRLSATADLVVMAAAPADFTPATRSSSKIKKDGSGGLRLDLMQTTDVLASLVQHRTKPEQVLVGFAAETPIASASLLDLGRQKLIRKGCDLLVLNEVGENKAFGQPDNEIVLLTEADARGPYAGSKDLLAHLIWDRALELRPGA